MRLMRGIFVDERKLISWRPDTIDWRLDKRMLDANTVTLAASFNDIELQEIQQHDRERQRNDEKIIVGAGMFNITIINPINLKEAVESSLITKLEILLKEDRYHLLKSPALQLIENCAFKHLYIATSKSFTLESSHAENVIRLINIYKGTLNELTLHFAKVNITAFSRIQKGVEDWIINAPITPLTICLNAECDINDKPCKSILEYNDMQQRLQFLIDCKYYSTLFKKTTEKQKRDELCSDIVEHNPEFTISFCKYAPSQIKKFTGDDHIYNTFLGHYMDNSIILNYISESYYNKTKEGLPYNIKKQIVELSGGIGVIVGIDDALENDNRATDQQDEVINHAEAMNDINLTTSGTTIDCSCCLII